MTPCYGARCEGGITRFRVRAPRASALWLCVFSAAGEQRVAMQPCGDDWTCELPVNGHGITYGYRAEGEWAPERGLWFDPAKLLVDPYAVELDKRFVHDPALTRFGVDTAHLVPRAIVPALAASPLIKPPHFQRGGLIYEINVRGFTLLHPDVPKALRGTVAALAEPAIIAHLKTLHVTAVELMPIVAWIDERHLGPLGLSNAWGYNPVALMALDPGICPGGVAELRSTVAALQTAGIGVILDLVFNHTGESDIHGGVLSLRGLDNAAYAHAAPDVSLINDTGCGNTLDFANPAVRALTLASLRHFVGQCGVDGFRFDLAPIMARGPGFAADAPIFAEIAADPLLADRIMIAEPWDIGPGGYQLGNFPAHFLEWNDRFRDDVRRFWRGDGRIADLVTRVAGSSDIFKGECRSVNFLAAHDGFTLADTVAYAHKHNLPNGEHNRDGHDDNQSWNCGSEGPSNDPEVSARRSADVRALLGTLFASTGTIMLTAGDEFGRSQQGNNNAYAQDNRATWINWHHRDQDLAAHVTSLASARAAQLQHYRRFPEGGRWIRPDGEAMTVENWEDPAAQAVSYILGNVSLPTVFEIDRPQRTIGWTPLP